jgi:hypothetical protein
MAAASSQRLRWERRDERYRDEKDERMRDGRDEWTGT